MNPLLDSQRDAENDQREADERRENHRFRFFFFLGIVGFGSLLLTRVAREHAHVLRAERGSQSLLTLFCHIDDRFNLE